MKIEVRRGSKKYTFCILTNAIEIKLVLDYYTDNSIQWSRIDCFHKLKRDDIDVPDDVFVEAKQIIKNTIILA
jgi:hypothetical protein